jgi:hypothetical protein
MKPDSSLYSFLSRLGLAVVALALIYLKFGPPSYEEVDLVNEIIYLLVVPLFLIGGTIAVCFLIGMPIRLIPKVFNWWYRHPLIPTILLVIGISFCFLSIQPQFISYQKDLEKIEPSVKQIPNFNILTIGWFLTGFSLTHLYLKPLFNSILNVHRFLTPP